MNKIALLKGGLNSENEVSLKTAHACSYALKELNYEIVEIDIKDKFFLMLLPDDLILKKNCSKVVSFGQTYS